MTVFRKFRLALVPEDCLGVWDRIPVERSRSDSDVDSCWRKLQPAELKMLFSSEEENKSFSESLSGASIGFLAMPTHLVEIGRQLGALATQEDKASPGRTVTSFDEFVAQTIEFLRFKEALLAEPMLADLMYIGGCETPLATATNSYIFNLQDKEIYLDLQLADFGNRQADIEISGEISRVRVSLKAGQACVTLRPDVSIYYKDSLPAQGVLVMVLRAIDDGQSSGAD